MVPDVSDLVILTLLPRLPKGESENCAADKECKNTSSNGDEEQLGENREFFVKQIEQTATMAGCFVPQGFLVGDSEGVLVVTHRYTSLGDAADDSVFCIRKRLDKMQALLYNKKEDAAGGSALVGRWATLHLTDSRDSPTQ